MLDLGPKLNDLTLNGPRHCVLYRRQHFTQPLTECIHIEDQLLLQLLRDTSASRCTDDQRDINTTKYLANPDPGQLQATYDRLSS